MYLLCILHSYISDSRMNIVRVSFYVSGEFKYKNVVLVVISSAELWVDYPAGVTSVTKPSMPDHVHCVLTRG